MSIVRQEVRAGAVALQRAFDRGFAEPLQFAAPATENLLSIRVGDEPWALRLTEIAGLYADRRTTRVPGGAACLIGIAGFRGTPLPVYSLQALLALAGARTGASRGAPRLLAVAAVEPVALAFHALDGHLRVSPDAIVPASADAALRGCAKDFVRTPNFAGPILHLPSLLAVVGTPGGKTVANTSGRSNHHVG
jgi:chemotaxis signal transduction protein